MFPTEVYNLTVLPGTRNHKGYFVEEDIYKLVNIDASGWAFICQKNSTCHYVDPDNLREISAQIDSDNFRETSVQIDSDNLQEVSSQN